MSGARPVNAVSRRSSTASMVSYTVAGRSSSPSLGCQAHHFDNSTSLQDRVAHVSMHVKVFHIALLHHSATDFLRLECPCRTRLAKHPHLLGQDRGLFGLDRQSLRFIRHVSSRKDGARKVSHLPRGVG
jgi:hypothetical protein